MGDKINLKAAINLLETRCPDLEFTIIGGNPTNAESPRLRVCARGSNAGFAVPADENVVRNVVYAIEQGALEQVKAYSQSLIQHICDYQMVKEKLCVRLVPGKKNNGSTAQYPYLEIGNGDIRVVCYVLVDKEARIAVTNKLLKAYGISREQLFEDAIRSTATSDDLKIQTIDDTVEEIIGMPVPIHTPFTFMCARGMMCGAAIVALPGMLDLMARSVGGSFYLLPSSVNEWFYIPEKDWLGSEAVTTVIKECNTMLAAGDFLSDTPYFYNAETKVLEPVKF